MAGNAWVGVQVAQLYKRFFSVESRMVSIVSGEAAAQTMAATIAYTKCVCAMKFA